MKHEKKQLTEDKLSRRQERMLLKALASVVLTEFPNLKREGCPGTGILRLIATKELPMRDPAFEHVGRCSPCFREIRELRAEIRRKRTWKAMTGATIIVLAALAGYLTFRLPHVPARAVPPSAPLYESVSADLRDFHTTRGESSELGNQHASILRVPRRPLELTIYLPIGFLEGEYDVQIADSGEAPLATGTGTAAFEDYMTKLRVNLDTTFIREGEYRLQIRPIGFSWRQYPLVVQ